MFLVIKIWTAVFEAKESFPLLSVFLSKSLSEDSFDQKPENCIYKKII